MSKETTVDFGTQQFYAPERKRISPRIMELLMDTHYDAAGIAAKVIKMMTAERHQRVIMMEIRDEWIRRNV